MKKLFSIVLAVVMVLSIASVAMAFAWDASAGTDATKFNERYKIEVVKLALETGSYATNRVVDSPNATAVNGADVYFAIRLTITGADVKDPDAIQENAFATVSITALDKNNVNGKADIPLKGLGDGVYYYNAKTSTFELITTNDVQAAIVARCLDTATAKVYAKVYSNRPLGDAFQVGSYWVTATGSTVVFADKKDASTNKVTFNCAGNGKVESVEVGANNVDGQFVVKLYSYLGITASDIGDGKVFMTKDNLRAFLGFGFKNESSITWKANSTPIILDPTVGIPKTGDNASVIGFAMIMVAVVAAAVAVKKVNA